jgi:hypothetical protein
VRRRGRGDRIADERDSNPDGLAVNIADAAVEAAGIQSGMSWSQLHHAVATAFGHPITIAATEERIPPTITGLTLYTKDHAQILFKRTDDALYSGHSILHEFGHILLDSFACSAQAGAISNDLSNGVIRVRTRELDLDSMDPAARVTEDAAERIAFLLARAVYGRQFTPEEMFFG